MEPVVESPPRPYVMDDGSYRNDPIQNMIHDAFGKLSVDAKLLEEMFGLESTRGGGGSKRTIFVLEKEKLTGTNFLDWYKNLRIVLKQERKLYVLEGPIRQPPETNAPKVERDAYKKHHDDALDIERNLVGPHVLKMIGYIENIERLGFPMGQELATDVILQSLPQSYNHFIMNYNMNEIDKSLPELLSMLRTAEQNLQKSKPNVILMVQKGKGEKKGNGKTTRPEPTLSALRPKGGVDKEGECFHCHNPGHWSRNCSIYLEDLKKKRGSETSISGIYVIEVNATTSTSWELKRSKTLAKGEIVLRVRSGGKVATIVVGTHSLLLPSGMFEVVAGSEWLERCQISE
ncbi:retrotransposon protein, putative, Ty1-copia subclass [Senna tora]|uniref:Retrotransposon protein, putative, Ty1-copia subclass n=1 Tax=Senna tora TaxID=362788 RepID=A0A834TRF5_9FABA|nr:retrotransposon protein, putative, Ty1-copia subclass [Senna tora]